MTITIGPIAGVPTPNDPVASKWAQDLTTFAVNDITIGAVAPTDPNAELWYDTADAGVSFPNMPRGHVATAYKSADQTGIGAGPTQISDLVLTWTAPAARKYRATVAMTVTATAAGPVNIYIRLDGGDLIRVITQIYSVAGYQYITPFVYIGGPAAQAHTLTVWAGFPSGGGTVGGAALGTVFILEDIGGA